MILPHIILLIINNVNYNHTIINNFSFPSGTPCSKCSGQTAPMFKIKIPMPNSCGQQSNLEEKTLYATT